MQFPGPSAEADDAAPAAEREAVTSSDDHALDDELGDGDDAGEDQELSAIDGVLDRVSARLEDDRRRRRRDDRETPPGAGGSALAEDDPVDRAAHDAPGPPGEDDGPPAQEAFASSPPSGMKRSEPAESASTGESTGPTTEHESAPPPHTENEDEC